MEGWYECKTNGIGYLVKYVLTKVTALLKKKKNNMKTLTFDYSNTSGR